MSDNTTDELPEPQPGNCSVCLLPVCKHVSTTLAKLERERDAWISIAHDMTIKLIEAAPSIEYEGDERAFTDKVCRRLAQAERERIDADGQLANLRGAVERLTRERNEAREEVEKYQRYARGQATTIEELEAERARLRERVAGLQQAVDELRHCKSFGRWPELESALAALPDPEPGEEGA